MSTPDQNREHAERIVSAIFAARDADCPMPFALYRHQDVTGVSGSGTVAHGVQFADGTVVIRWRGDNPSTVVWGSLDAAMHVHGHDGKTRVVWLAAPFSEMAKAEEEAAAAERARILKIAERVKEPHRQPGTGTPEYAVPLALLRAALSETGATA